MFLLLTTDFIKALHVLALVFIQILFVYKIRWFANQTISELVWQHSGQLNKKNRILNQSLATKS